MKVSEGRSFNYRVDDCDWLIAGRCMHAECEMTLGTGHKVCVLGGGVEGKLGGMKQII